MALDTTEGAIVLAFGLGLLAFHRPMARASVTFHKSLSIRGAGETFYRVAYVLGGLVFTLVGLLGLGVFG